MTNKIVRNDIDLEQFLNQIKLFRFCNLPASVLLDYKQVQIGFLQFTGAEQKYLSFNTSSFQVKDSATPCKIISRKEQF